MERLISKYLANLEAEYRKRVLPEDDNDSPEATPRLDLLSNDYLGLTNLEEVRNGILPEFVNGLTVRNMSSSASRLLCRNNHEMFALENQLSTLFCKEALLFNSGYHANVGIISALAALDNVLFLCDKYIHASVIDGLSMSKANFLRFRHNDMKSLRRLLETHASENTHIVIVTEGIFSMTGDRTPIKEIVGMKRAFPNVMIYLDEAHSFGVIGRQGKGLAELEEVAEEVDIRILTFGKALASSGAAAITSPTIKQWLVNSARPLIFSTALPPACCKWTSKMIDVMTRREDLRQHLQELSHYARNKINNTTTYQADSDSQILPIITGDAESACSLAQKLKRANIDVLPIRRPTVPPGQEGVRLSLSASLTFKDIDYIIDSLK